MEYSVLVLGEIFDDEEAWIETIKLHKQSIMSTEHRYMLLDRRALEISR